MAERRMFAKAIIDSDAFLDMPLSTQALYFHLAMRADDEGFVGNPKKIQRMIGASDDDCRILITKRFILTFQSGIIVIKHWKIHNYIQTDRFKETTYLEEKATLTLDGKKAYTECIQNGYNLETQDSIGKSKLRLELGKSNLNNNNKKKEDDIEEKEKSSSSSKGNLKSNLDAFLEKFGIMLDDYGPNISEMDFELLTERFEESEWLKKNISSFKKVCELYPKIISGYYKEYNRKPKDNSYEMIKKMLEEAEAEEKSDEDKQGGTTQ